MTAQWALLQIGGGRFPIANAGDRSIEWLIDRSPDCRENLQAPLTQWLPEQFVIKFRGLKEWWWKAHVSFELISLLELWPHKSVYMQMKIAYLALYLAACQTLAVNCNFSSVESSDLTLRLPLRENISMPVIADCQVGNCLVGRM